MTSKTRLPRKIRSGRFSDLARAAVDAGWTIEMTSNGHAKWTSPDGQIVFSPSTTSDWRATRNVRSKLRHAGLDV